MSSGRFSINKRSIFAILTLIFICVLIFVEVDTRQGVDYKVTSYRMPLYIKIIEFVDRDYQYRRIVKNIVQKYENDEEKVLAIFNWCVENIKNQPKELPVVDDHPLNIIIRGYGAGDQFEDIFTILCTYAGFEAFYRELRQPDGRHYLISFVRIGKEWYPFSVNSNASPIENGRLISIRHMSSDPGSMTLFKARLPAFDERAFLREVDNISFKAESVRVKGQSPIGRLGCWLKSLK